MKRLMLYCLAVCCSLSLKAQLLTWTPAFPKDNDNITITVDATKGNQGLLGFAGNVYVHIGAITNLSTDPSNWLHAPFTWGSTEAAALATPAGTNKWSYTINNPRTFFGLAAGEQLKSIAILFRQGNCTTCSAQRNADGTDMYVPIYTSALAVRIDLPPSQPKYTRVPEPQTWVVGTNFSITANASAASTMKIYHNGTQLATASGVQTLSASSSVLAAGNQQIVAEANDGTTTRYDTVNILVLPTTWPVAALPAGVRDGINYEPGDTSATLVLRAPGKNKAFAIGEFNNWLPSLSGLMSRTPDGKFFWVRLHPLTPGTEYAYQFLVDDTIKVADPYTEKILDPGNDGSISPATYPGLRAYPTGQTGIVSVLQTAAPAYNWTSGTFARPDKRNLVIYEMLARDFVQAHDWKTIGDSLNYLKNLGINAIELMPLNEFEGNDSWGYNPDFYFAPDKYYGPAKTLKAFVDSCHKRGIAVIMDIALNHSFGSSPMVQLYWDAANNRPSAGNPWFNPVAKHAFNVGFDMNHESLDTRYYVSRVVEHWLQQYRIDGFRFDLSKGFTQKQTCDNTGNNCDVNAFGQYDATRIAIWKRYYDSVQLKSAGAYAILEHFADNTEEIELSNYGMMLWGNLNYNYAQASMGYNTDWDFSYGIYTVRNWTNPYLVTYMESHDEERIVYKNLNFGVNTTPGYNIRDTTIALQRMELASAFFLTIPGPKMIWQFGELGYPYSINQCTGNSTVADACRTADKPIRWDYLNDARRKNIYNVYSRLNALRFHPWYRQAFMTGAIDRSLGNAFKWIKVSSGDTSHLVVIGNFGTTAQTGAITFPAAGNWFDYLNNTTFTATGGVQNITLQAGEYHVYVNRNVNNLSTTPVSSINANADKLQARLYPNPAFTSFTLDVQMPQSSNLQITLYNALGQPVAELYDGFLAKGSHSLDLKRKNIPKGVYYVRLKTRSAGETLPVTLQ